MKHFKIFSYILVLAMILTIFPSVVSAAGVATSTIVEPSGNGLSPGNDGIEEYGPFYVNGYYYCFYFMNSYFSYRTSSDLVTWSAVHNIWSNYANCVVFDGTHFYIVSNENTYILKFCMGTPNGDGTLTLGATHTIATSVKMANCMIDNNGHLVIVCCSSGSPMKPLIYKNANTDGTWSNVSNSPLTLNATGSTSWYYLKCIQLSNGNYAIAYRASGTVLNLKIVSSSLSILSEESISAVSTDYWDMTNVGDNLYFLYENSALYLKVRDSSGNWGSAINVKASYSANVGLTADISSGKVNIYYQPSTTLYYRTYYNSALTAEAIFADNSLVSGGYIISPTYTINHKWFVECCDSASPHKVLLEYVSLPTWKPAITSTPANTGMVGTSYSYSVTTNESSTVHVNSIPSWASLNGAVISGTPTQSGSAAFSIYATSNTGLGNQWQNWTVDVASAPVSQWAPSFVNSPSTTNIFGEIYTFDATCNESVTYTYEFPAWAGMIDNNVTGLADAVGSYNFSLTATSVSGGLPVTQNWTVLVSEYVNDEPNFINLPKSEGKADSYFSTSIATENTTDTITVETNAEWLIYNSSNGMLYGIAREGSYWVNITALSQSGMAATYNYTLTIPHASIVIPPVDENGTPVIDSGSIIFIAGIIFFILGVALTWKYGIEGAIFIILGIIIIALRISGVI